MRVIGVGTTLRGDDGAGLEVARRLGADPPAGVEVVACGGGVAELIDAWDGASSVLVIDATRSGAPPGTVVELSPTAASLATRGGGTHDAGVGDAIALATALGCLPPDVRVIGIEIGSTALGQEALSPPVDQAVDAVVAQLRRYRDATASSSTAL